MRKATRVMNILAGIIILSSGIYVGYMYQGILSQPARIMITLLAVAYFCYQIVTELPKYKKKAETGGNQVESIQF